MNSSSSSIVLDRYFPWIETELLIPDIGNPLNMYDEFLPILMLKIDITTQWQWIMRKERRERRQLFSAEFLSAHKQSKTLLFTCNCKFCEYNLIDFITKLGVTPSIYRFSLLPKPKTIKVQNIYFGTKSNLLYFRLKSNLSKSKTNLICV